MIRQFHLRLRAVGAPAAAAAMTLLLVSGALSAAAATAPRVLYTDPTTKPSEPGLLLAVTPFDCAALDTLTLAAGTFGTVIRGDTTSGPTLLPGYGCLSWSEQGPEHIYRLEVTEDLQLWAGLSELGANDLDIFLLDGCDTDQCLAGANTELQMLLPAGTYWLVVDGYGTTNPAAGPYTLTLDTRWPGVPPQVCQPGGAIPITCAGAPIPLDGDLLGAVNLLQSYDCSPALASGGEQWYAVTLPETHEVSVRALPSGDAPALDLVLWLFDGCGAAAVCIGYADQKAGGQVETLAFENTSGAPVTFWLAVDARRSPTNPGSGEYGLDFNCQSNVANEVRSAGSVKALYR